MEKNEYMMSPALWPLRIVSVAETTLSLAPWFGCLMMAWSVEYHSLTELTIVSLHQHLS